MESNCLMCGKVIVFKGIRGGRNAKTCSKTCRKARNVRIAHEWQKNNRERYRAYQRTMKERQREENRD